MSYAGAAIAVIMPIAEGQIRVEFYGLARQRTGTSTICIPAREDLTLDQLWHSLLDQFPRLAASGSDAAPPRSIYRINLDGQQFVSHPQTPISRGQCVLIMSADAGG
jgi:molybdopterin converting factor small subunit